MSYGFVEQDSGPLRVIREPEVGMLYTMGVDAATGLGDDYSSAQMLSNTIPSEQVAVFRAQWPVHEFTKFVDMFGRYYNEALNVCEINYPGNSVMDALLQYYKYPRNYQMEEHLDEDPNVSCKYGFRTTEASKWLLINETQIGLVNNEIIINDPLTLSEMNNFVYQSTKNKAGAASGFCDDTVLALMFAWHGVRLYPIIRPKGEVKKKAVNLDADSKRLWREFKAKINGPQEQGIVL